MKWWVVKHGKMDWPHTRDDKYECFVSKQDAINRAKELKQAFQTTGCTVEGSIHYHRRYEVFDNMWRLVAYVEIYYDR